MKTARKILYLFLCSVILFSCESNSMSMYDYTFPYLDESHINGQLCYKANPIDPENDTILCLDNVYIGFVGYDDDYCPFLRNLLSLHGGRFTECQFDGGGEHRWEYLAESEQTFYPINSKEFVSLIDPETGVIADSIYLNERIIYPKLRRNGDSDRVTRFYMGDFVLFQGSDYMKPRFISDTITSSGEQIICFDGHKGPILGDSRLTNNNPNIFN